MYEYMKSKNLMFCIFNFLKWFNILINQLFQYRNFTYEKETYSNNK